MKKRFIFTFAFNLILFYSCNIELPNTNNSYEEKLTVFSNIELQQLKPDSLIMNIEQIDKLMVIVRKSLDDAFSILRKRK